MGLVAGLARLAVVTFWLATSAFAFLSSVPFAHEQFIAPRLVPGLVEFAEWHPWMALAAVAPAAAAMYREGRRRRAGSAAATALGLSVVAGALLPLGPPLATLEPGPVALVVSVLALVIPLAIAVVDLRAAVPWPESQPHDRSGADFAAVALVSVSVPALHALRAWTAGTTSWPGAGASLAVHAVFGAAVFLLLTFVRGVAAIRPRATASREFWLIAVVVVAAFEFLAIDVILPALSVSGAGPVAAGAALAFTLALGLVARGRRRAPDLADGAQVALGVFSPRRVRGPGAIVPSLLWLTTSVAVAAGSAAASAVMDWNFVVARIGVVLTWLVAISGALALPRPLLARPTAGWAFLVCLGVLAAHQAFVPPPGLAADTPAERWVVADPSYRLLREALRPPAPADRTFYPFLQRHTNLGRDVAVAPVDVSLAPLGGAPAPRRPHVFLFVVDSLRRDYLSPYNDAVTFTPSIQRFATESVVYDRVFTRYGATGLSVPSIWVGGMLLHKQYVTPFAPMNTLHKLLAHEQYERWMSWDNVVDATVPREHEGPALDSGRAVKDFRFCDTLAELTPRLDALTKNSPPVFVWALPQDIHISAITREGKAVVGAGGYGAFYAPYASRIARFDTCFGQFVDRLKARGLYDDSVVILTADHGDSLGEDGRWGHAYTLFPEILQVPLIMHVPSWFREAHTTDPSALAFTTDITPTLYAMLGHVPSPPGPMFGQPLFWPAGEARPKRVADGHLVASSYGSVYGWLTDDGRRLYVADGVDFRDYLFDLDGTPTGKARPVGADDRRRGQQAIRDAVGDIAKFYRFSK